MHWTEKAFVWLRLALPKHIVRTKMRFGREWYWSVDQRLILLQAPIAADDLLQPDFSPTAKLRIRPFAKGCRESGTNLIFLHRWGGKVDSRRFVLVVWDERCPFSCFRHFFGFGCHNHSNSLPMYVAPARRRRRVRSRRRCAFFYVPSRSW